MIAYICPNLGGHVSVLRRFFPELEPYVDQHLILVHADGWESFPSATTIPTTVLKVSPCTSTNPIEWTEMQARELQQRGQMAKYLRFWKPDVIVYDIFIRVEWLQSLFPHIRFICSIPAFLRDWVATEQGSSMAQISDGQYDVAPVNIVWSVAAADAPQPNHVMVGYPVDRDQVCLEPCSSQIPTVLISLGTVILSPYMWCKHPAIRDFVWKLFQQLIVIARELPQVRFLFVSGRVRTLRSYVELQMLPNVEVVKYIPQFKRLAEGDVRLLITHGGNNSVQEALVARVPMLVIPFFGDQHDTAEWVHTHDLGCSIPPDSQMAGPDRCLDGLSALVHSMIQWERARFPATPRTFLSPAALILDSLPLQSGDVVLGCNADRQKYLSDRELDPLIFGFVPQPNASEQAMFQWMEHHVHPQLLDNYLDLLRHRQVDLLDLRLDASTPVREACCRTMDAVLDRGYRLHFLLDRYDAKTNPVTRQELLHILQHHNRLIDRQIFFYSLTPRLCRINLYHSQWLTNTLDVFIDLLTATHSEGIKSIHSTLNKLHEFVSFRGKSSQSIQDNLERENQLNRALANECFRDIFGFRLVMTTTAQVEALRDAINHQWGPCGQGRLQHMLFSEHGSVAHMILDHHIEVQIWTDALLYGLKQEHSTVYKKKGFWTEQGLFRSRALHKAQRLVQDTIDEHFIEVNPL